MESVMHRRTSPLPSAAFIDDDPMVRMLWSGLIEMEEVDPHRARTLKDRVALTQAAAEGCPEAQVKAKIQRRNEEITWRGNARPESRREVARAFVGLLRARRRAGVAPVRVRVAEVRPRGRRTHTRSNGRRAAAVTSRRRSRGPDCDPGDPSSSRRLHRGGAR